MRVCVCAGGGGGGIHVYKATILLKYYIFLLFAQILSSQCDHTGRHMLIRCLNHTFIFD